MPNIGDNIIPSHMKIVGRKRFSDGNIYSDFALRYGEVQNVIYPGDDLSRSKRFVEYNVFVQYRAANKSANGRIYNNCILANPLGGLADRSTRILRGENSATKPDNNRLGKGSKVLILCLNGETTQPIIISGLQDPNDHTDDNATKDDGNNSIDVYNGIKTVVNGDGELIVTYTGKSLIDGKRDDNVKDSQVGTYFTLLKDGTWQVATISGSDIEQFFKINHTDKHIQAQAKNNFEVVAGKKSTFKQENFEIGDATDKMLLASTYRDQENQLNQLIQQNMSQLQELLITAGAAITAAAAVPSVATVPLSALSPAGIALTQAATCASNISQAITKFEAQQDDYLSKRNKND